MQNFEYVKWRNVKWLLLFCNNALFAMLVSTVFTNRHFDLEWQVKFLI